MSILQITLAYIRAKFSTTLLHVITMAMGVALITSIIIFGNQIQDKFFNNGKNIDVVVGAKGSPLQLVLSTIQHIDIPTGNISLADANKISRHKNVKQAIPISLGDSYRKFRIVGTEKSYLENFNANYQQGNFWSKSMQAVIGADVAKESGLKINDKFVGNHGLMPSGPAHDSQPYTIVGILQPTGTVIDKLIVTSLESVWDLHSNHGSSDMMSMNKIENNQHKNHESHDNHVKHKEHKHDEHKHVKSSENKEITALLIKYRNHAAALSFPRYINSKTSMQAASPAFEIARLMELLGVGTNTAMIFAIFLVSISLISVLVGLFNSIEERKYDIALFRIMGASKTKIIKLIMTEGMLISIIGSFIGVVLGYVFIYIIANYSSRDIGLNDLVFYPEILYAILFLWILSSLICLIPALKAYRNNIKDLITHV